MQNLINWDGVKYLITNAAENDGVKFTTGKIEVRFYYDEASMYDSFEVVANNVDELAGAVCDELASDPDLLLKLDSCETVGTVDVD